MKIDRQLAPLSARLVNGQTIEVITASSGRPNPAWLDFVVTSKAKSGIRHFLKTRRHKEATALGKQLLKQALRTHHLSLRQIPQSIWEYFFKEASMASMDDLYAEIGIGDRVSSVTANRLVTLLDDLEVSPGAELEDPASDQPLYIKGTEGLLVEFADCCCPVPGDLVVGILTSGRGIIVHRDDCRQIASLRRNNPEQCMPMRWAEDSHSEFQVSVKVQVMNRRGTLAAMAQAISEAESNVADIKVDTRDGQQLSVVFKLMVHDRKHLALVLRRLRQIKSVIKITRMK